MLYFLPSVVAWHPDMAERFGLSRVLDGRPSGREVTNGPGGKSGLLIADRSVPAGQVEFHRDAQTWQPRYGSEAWMGFTTNEPPGPLELERSHQIDGKQIRLGDLQDWIVPQLRQFDATEGSESLVWRCRLEQTITQDPETGRLSLGEVVKKYAAIWDAATPIAASIESQILQGKSASIDDETFEKFPAELLNLNYRVELPELAMLGLLSTVTLGRITQLGLDIDTLRRNSGNLQRRIIRSGTPATESGETLPTED